MRTSIALGALAGLLGGAVLGYTAWAAAYEFRSRRLEHESSGTGSLPPLEEIIRREFTRIGNAAEREARGPRRPR
jgi:hypothetical protein